MLFDSERCVCLRPRRHVRVQRRRCEIPFFPNFPEIIKVEMRFPEIPILGCMRKAFFSVFQNHLRLTECVTCQKMEPYKPKMCFCGFEKGPMDSRKLKMKQYRKPQMF